MKHRHKWRIGQVRKYNTFLNNCANRAHSPTLKIMILAGKINFRRNGHPLQKGP